VLLVLVGRSKQCFDFAATVHGFHLLACAVYGGWPRTAFWWALNILSLIVMAVLAEWLCMRHELLPITLAGKDLSRPGAAAAAAGEGGGGNAIEMRSLDGRPGALV
jgi:hypothetical protein